MNRLLVFLLLILSASLIFGLGGYAAGEETVEGIIEIETDNEAEEKSLAEGYIYKTMYGSQNSTKTRGQYLLGSNLTGIDSLLYDFLCRDIKEVAAGQRVSTVFVYQLETFLSQLTFTAEDLGVETLFVDENLTSEAENALNETIRSYHAANIVYALLADCPFDLYWYNKSTGGGCKVSFSFSFLINTEGDTETVTASGYVKFSMAVAEEYAAGTYTMDTSYGQAVSAAAENAQFIVEQYEDLPDYDRLLAYKNIICDLTAYNYEAANNGVSYGNPWQLVWVFDGNAETNVVCEGYAKAFQFLNDLSSSPVTVISPQGTINGRPHMWNIVSMENGRNYLVDVTNCDSGMAGYPNKLFMVGYSSGSVKEGYRVATGHTYIFSSNSFPVEELTISSWNYLDAWPDVPECTFSTGKGYVGYQLAVLLNEDADGIVVQETGEEFPCKGRVALIPLTETGKQCYTIAAVRDGLMSDYGETHTIQVTEMSGSALTLPAGTQTIETEAFRGVSAAVVIVPPSASIGDYAFADNESLIFADVGDAALGEGAFDNCPNLVCCFTDAGKGFSEGLSFVVK